MTLRHLTSADYKVMPWKNGLGTTRELIAVPTEGGDGFAWRISIADVGADGPFSLFPHIDRTIMLIDGAGMTLEAGPHGRFELLKPFQPVDFKGEWPIEGRLAAGPVRDFNVMADRRHVCARLAVFMADAETRAPDPVGSIHVLHTFGTVLARWPDGRELPLAAGDSLVVEDETLPCISTGAGQGVPVAVVGMIPVRQLPIFCNPGL